MDTIFSSAVSTETLQIGDGHHTMGRPIQQIQSFLLRECRNENCEKSKSVGFLFVTNNLSHPFP